MSEEMYIYGRNAVKAKLETEETINKAWIQKDIKSKELSEIVSKLKEDKIPIVFAEKEKLNILTNNQNHQGVVISTNPFKYVDIEDILEKAHKLNETPFIVILDRIEDTHNLGAIIRSAEAGGVHGIIIPKRNSAQVTSLTSKTSAGAISNMLVCRVPNIVSAMERLKKEGLWIVGTSLEGKMKHTDANLKGVTVLVIGNEEEGMSKLVTKTCDMLVKIPMKGKVQSLNASVSAGIMIYEIMRQND